MLPIVAATVALLAALGALVAPAAAATEVPVGPAPVVRIVLRASAVTVRTWSRDVVRIDGPPEVAVATRSVTESPGERRLLIPGIQADGRAGRLSLPPENFVVSLPGGRHDVVAATSAGPESGPTTVTVPQGTEFLFVRTRAGPIDVDGYGGTLVAFSGRGAISLANDAGTVFAQTLRGPIEAVGANVVRLRARSLFGNLTFERCAVTQIEATSIQGSIVFDAGTFAPGLARFESQHGDVAVGSTSGATLDGRAGAGRVFTDFDAGTDVRATAAAATARPVGGGPLVAASSGTGNVFLFDGTLRDQRRFSAAWAEPQRTLADPRARELPAAAPSGGTAAGIAPSNAAPLGRGATAPGPFAPRRPFGAGRRFGADGQRAPRRAAPAGRPGRIRAGIFSRAPRRA